MPDGEASSGQAPEPWLSLSSQMLKTRVINIDDAQAGQTLAKDAEVGFTTLLAAGTVLTEERIKQLKTRGIEQIIIAEVLPDEVAPEMVSEMPVTEQLDDYEVVAPAEPVSENELEAALENLLKSGNGPGLTQFERKMRKVPSLHGHAQAYTRAFDDTCEIPRREMTADEAVFSRQKEDIRSDAGLAPVIPPAFAATVRKRLRRTLSEMPANELISKPTLEEMSILIMHNLNLGADSYLHLDDITDREDYIPAHTLRTMLTFFSVNGEGSITDTKREEFVKGIISHNLGFAKLVSNTKKNGGFTASGMQKLHDDYRNLYQTMRRANGIDESVLELIFLQNEHCDGSGFPYRLSGDSIPFESQCLSISNRFSHLTLSKPRMPRLNPREASMRIIASSGTQFQSQAVHTFLGHTGVYPNGSLIKLSDQANAVVTRQNPDAILRPVVRRVEWADGQHSLSEPVDLKQNGVFVTGANFEY
jgi:HD-GYP domain-containing protein (c-di-GMP phosphodiesterase class II)